MSIEQINSNTNLPVSGLNGINATDNKYSISLKDINQQNIPKDKERLLDYKSKDTDSYYSLKNKFIEDNRTETILYVKPNPSTFILPQLPKLQYPGLGLDSTFIELPFITKDKKLYSNLNNVSTKPIINELPSLTTIQESPYYINNIIEQRNSEKNYILNKLNSTYNNEVQTNSNLINSQV